MRIANQDLGVHDLAVRRRHSEEFLSAEGLRIKVDGLRCTSNGEVGSHCAVAIGNWFYLVFHDYLLRLDSWFRSIACADNFPRAYLRRADIGESTR